MNLKINVEGVNVMKLKVKNGKVAFIMTAGKDFVRSEMSEEAANNIIRSGVKHITNMTFEGFPICITNVSEFDNNTYYFAAYTEKKKKEPAVKKGKTGE